MRPGQEQRYLRWGDIVLKTDSNSARFLQYSTERQTKTRTGENPRNQRDVKPVMYENEENPEMPAHCISKIQRRKTSWDVCRWEPFLFRHERTNATPGKKWFKNCALRVNPLRSMMQNILEDVGLETDRKTVNHNNLWTVKYRQTRLFKLQDNRTWTQLYTIQLYRLTDNSKSLLFCQIPTANLSLLKLLN